MAIGSGDGRNISAKIARFSGAKLANNFAKFESLICAPVRVKRVTDLPAFHHDRDRANLLWDYAMPELQ